MSDPVDGGSYGRLEGKVALVTGCARSHGMGRGIAEALAAAGASVAVTDVAGSGTRNAIDVAEEPSGWRGLESTVEGLQDSGADAVGLIGDVSIKADAERIVAEVIEQFGRIDILVNNAAAPQGADRQMSWDVPEDWFDLVMRVNTKGVFLMSTAVARHLIDQGRPGRIVNIASGAGRRGYAKCATYCASKFAVIGLTQAMALELAAYGVTVNAVCPGPIATSRSGGPISKATIADIPVGRVGSTTDVAHAVMYFACDDADFVTGQSFNVDGGLIMS